MTKTQVITRFPREAILWLSGLAFLLFITPDDVHFSLCPLHYLGFSHCPGCGLGKSISLLFHGDWKQSFQTHLLGIPAFLILIFRIIQLVKNHFKFYGQNH